MSQKSPLDEYAAYPFDSDQVYKQGLASILANNALANNPNSEEKEEILRRTRVFYFNKTTGNSITLEEAKAYEESLRQQRSALPQSSTPAATAFPDTKSESTTATAQPKGEEEPRVLTFAELKELIEAGKLDEIPNNKVIPNTINEAPPSQSTAQARKKPWELASEGQDTSTSISEAAESV